MEIFRTDREFARSLAIVVVMVTLCAALVGASAGLEAASDEGGVLEIAQEVYLLLATVTFALAALLSRGEARMACFGASLLALTFFLRELELESVGPVTAYLNTTQFRWHQAIVSGKVALAYLHMRWRHVPALVAYALSRRAWPFHTIGLLLLAGGLLDGREHLLNIEWARRFAEETLETIAYATLSHIALHVATRVYRARWKL